MRGRNASAASIKPLAVVDFPICHKSGSVDHAEEAPRIGDALERVLPTVFEAEPGAESEVLYGGGDEDLAGGCRTLGSGGDVDRHAGKTVAFEFALAGVDAGSDLDLLRGGCGSHRARGLNGPGRGVESHKEPVSRRVDLRSVVTGDLLAHALAVFFEKTAPARVA